jgi:hypothetical protein
MLPLLVIESAVATLVPVAVWAVVVWMTGPVLELSVPVRLTEPAPASVRLVLSAPVPVSDRAALLNVDSPAHKSPAAGRCRTGIGVDVVDQVGLLALTVPLIPAKAPVPVLTDR